MSAVDHESRIKKAIHSAWDILNVREEKEDVDEEHKHLDPEASHAKFPAVTNGEAHNVKQEYWDQQEKELTDARKAEGSKYGGE